MDTLKIINSEKIYHNKHADVIVDTLAFKGKQWEQVYIQKPFKDAVGILPIDEKGIYLVKQYRHPIGEDLWQIIMGSLEKNYSPLQTAQIELKEEAGIYADNLSVIGEIFADPGISSQKTTIFLAEGLHFTTPTPSFTEMNIELKHFTYNQINDMIKNNDISCGYTLSALLLTHKHTKLLKD